MLSSRRILFFLIAVFGFFLHADAQTQISLSALGTARQSSNASDTFTADRAIDGNTGTSSLTADVPNSFWEVELGRPIEITRLELVANGLEANGLMLRVFDLRDRTVFQTTVSGVGAGGGTWATNLPSSIKGRIIRFALEGGQTNGAGHYRIALPEVRAFGNPSPAFGPAIFSGTATVMQSTTNGSLGAHAAVDLSHTTFSSTLGVTNDYWLMTFDSVRSIERVEVVNLAGPDAGRIQGLTLRILDAGSNTVASTTVTNPGPGATFFYTPPPGTTGRYLRIGLENGAVNGHGTYVVSLAEVGVFSGTNYAHGATSYMVRLTDFLAPPGNANDGNYATGTESSERTVDAYWEVDLGQTRALYSVRAVPAGGDAARLSHATVRLYNEAHDSVFSQHLGGSSTIFDVNLPGPILARFVRVGFENKERSSPPSIEWWLRLAEVQTFGRPADQVGLVSFSATQTQILASASTTLSWQEDGLYQLNLHPGIGSVGPHTALSGSGSINVAPATSSQYVLVGSNYNGNFTRYLTIEVNGQKLPARINEFVANNRLTLRDGQNESPDWIELHNPNNTSLDLSGYHLSDDPVAPTKWSFPAGVVIPPHGYLIVFASDRDNPFDSAGFLHASFNLNADGESVVLTAPDGVTVVDAALNFPVQREDLAYGRTLDGAWRFLDPTPSGPNLAPDYAGWLQPLTFSRQRGWFTNSFSLSIGNPNPASVVVYSTTGSEPAVPYVSPLDITSNATVRATVQRAGYKSPRVQTHSYLSIDRVLASPVMSTTYTQSAIYTNRLRQGLLDLPTFSLSVPDLPNNSDPYSEYVEREGSLEVIMPGGSSIVQANCGVLRFGGAWTLFSKRGYRLKFRPEYGTRKLEVPLFNGFDRGFLATDSFDELDLHGGNHDMSSRGFYMSARFSEDTMLDMGSLNPHGRFVHVYINGTYWGQYHAHERLVDAFLGDYLGGKTEDYVNVKGNDNGPQGFVPGTPDPLHREPWDFVRSNRFNYHTVKTNLDVAHLIDFMIMWSYGNAEQEFRSAGPILPGSGFKFWMADADGYLRTVGDRTGDAGPGAIFGGLISQNNSDFKTLLADRIYKHVFNNGALTPAANLARLNQRMNEITNSLVAECARWGQRTPATWESAAQDVRNNIFPTRTSSLLTQMRSRGWYPSLNAPNATQYGGSVTNGYPLVLSASGAVYYTLDGSDPRLPGGSTSPSTILWNGTPLIITSNVVVKARARLSGVWSALIELPFVIGQIKIPAMGDLLISELHYNPIGSDDYEFIELFNTSTNVLDLTNVRLADGLNYLFPNGFRLSPGGFTLVVENNSAFQQRYGNSGSPYYYPDLNVVGEWSGQLANEGERIVLLASNGVELASVNFSTGGAWPGRANNLGSSLELRDPLTAAATPASLNAHLARGPNWRSSALYHGSPGRLDTTLRRIVISEVIAHTDLGVDWLELQNVSPDPVDLNEFYLSDKYDDPFRYAFAPGTIIPASGFLIRSATQLGFGFSELGSDILLIEANGTNIIRFMDTTDIPAVDREEPFGRHTRSDDVVDFTELRVATQGTNNALPRIGPIVVSEIMYRPAVGFAEFVELVNIASTNVLFYDPLRPTNTWELSDAVDFKFPTGQQLAPGDVIIVCDTNPAVFRAQYNVDPSIPVYGPWSGALNNAGEALRLRRPGNPETNGFVPYYRVDRVRYEPVAPWPINANQGGISLERVPLEGYGNDPAHWEASAPGGTPGTFIGNREPFVVVDGDTSIPENSGFILDIRGADLDQPWQNVSVAAHTLPPGSSFNPVNGVFTWTPGEADGPGIHQAYFVVTDNGVIPQVRTQAIDLTVLEVNQEPSIDPVPDFFSPAKVPLAIHLSASDPDLPAQGLSFGASGLPAGLGIDPATGVITGAAEAAGTYPITVTVADDQSPPLTDQQEFTLHISEPFELQWMRNGNNPPQFSFRALPGETYEIQYTPDLDPPDWQLLQEIESAAGGLQPIPALPPGSSGFIRVLWIR